MELIAWNLSSEKNKEFIISPTLRMLREGGGGGGGGGGGALCFDGGALAKPIFRARMSTFKSLARNMGIKYLGDGTEEHKRPSARTNALRLFLSALKFLHPEAKRELLSQRDINGALTRSIKDDPPSVVLEVLDGLRQHVLLDDKVARDAKGKLLNSATLSRISLFTPTISPRRKEMMCLASKKLPTSSYCLPVRTHHPAFYAKIPGFYRPR